MSKKTWIIGGALFVLLIVMGLLYTWAGVERNSAQMQPGDGIRFGFIRSVSESAISFDEARWLIGADATSAAVAAGVCSAGEDACPPNDFFIVNDSETTEEIPLGADVLIAVVNMGSGTEVISEKVITRDELEKRIADPQFRDNPYHILVEQGKVTIIEETYVP